MSKHLNLFSKLLVLGLKLTQKQFIISERADCACYMGTEEVSPSHMLDGIS
jgi:hypothetical protein